MRHWCALAVLFAACASGPVTSPDAAEPAAAPLVAPQWAGTWRAVLDSPGGELAFELAMHDDDGLGAVVYNGDERLPFSSVVADGRTLRLRIDGYDSDIVATLSDDGQSLHGTWSKTAPNGQSTLPFHAYRGDAPRYTCSAPPGTGDEIAGLWDLTFREADGTSYVGRAEFNYAASSGELRGTILTDTGDYRYLAGCYGADGLQLSVFDGAHAFLFRAKRSAAGSLHGDFWSRDSYHAAFEAKRPIDDGHEPLADPYDIVQVTNPDGRVRFAFPDTQGNMVRWDDPRFAGKVVVLDIFGTWCPNCNDQAPILAAWHERFSDDGLEVVGLAYEYTGDAARDVEYLTKYAQRHGIKYPLLLAGTSDKTDASATLPDLSRVAAYPTTIFIGRDGRVHRIYSGFFGPATGLRHAQMLTEHEEIIRGLLATPG